MFLRPLQRLARQLLAGTAALALLVAQPAFLQCPCLLASETAVEGCCGSAKASCCCRSTGDDSQQSCCCPPAGPAGDDSDCTCTALLETPAAVPSAPVQVEHLDSNLGAAAAVPPFVLSCGLNGTAWSNAFDLAVLKGPPGLRLHALLSVWRN